MIRGKNSNAPVLAQIFYSLIILFVATSIDVVVVLVARDVDGQGLWSTVLLHGTKEVGAVVLGEEPALLDGLGVPGSGNSILWNGGDLLDLVVVRPYGLRGKVGTVHSWELLVALELVGDGIAEFRETPFGFNAHESVATKLEILILVLKVEINSEIHVGK